MEIDISQIEWLGGLADEFDRFSDEIESEKCGPYQGPNSMFLRPVVLHSVARALRLVPFGKFGAEG
ncbi:MAG: hypothetical protein NVS9B4_00520 [Candidatus Acidiferrum sp.]